MQEDVQPHLISSSGDGVIDYDDEFLQGLESILGPMRQAGASQEEIDTITERARQFYLSRKAPVQSSSNAGASPISKEGHSRELPTEERKDTVQDVEQSRGAVLAPETTSGSDDQPPYPLSFDQLAEMIATGAHIPGIRDIPDKLNESAPSEPVLAKSQVKKPWEKQDSVESRQSLLDVLGTTNGTTSSGQ